jgi:hypothetical protein
MTEVVRNNGSRFVTVRILYLMLIRLPYLPGWPRAGCAFCGLETCKSAHRGN